MLSSGSQHSADGDATEEEYKVFLGDDQPVVIGQQQPQREQVSVSLYSTSMLSWGYQYAK